MLLLLLYSNINKSFTYKLIQYYFYSYLVLISFLSYMNVNHLDFTRKQETKEDCSSLFLSVLQLDCEQNHNALLNQYIEPICELIISLYVDSCWFSFYSLVVLQWAMNYLTNSLSYSSILNLYMLMNGIITKQMSFINIMNYYINCSILIDLLTIIALFILYAIATIFRLLSWPETHSFMKRSSQYDYSSE